MTVADIDYLFACEKHYTHILTNLFLSDSFLKLVFLKWRMDCFWCEVASGELKLLEAEAARWLTKEELDSVQWLPADVTLIDKIKSCMS